MSTSLKSAATRSTSTPASASGTLASAADARTHLLDVAEELFAQHGFVATSTRMVAGVANINLGSLHYYFSSKEALYLAVFQRRGLPMVAERIHLLTQAQAKYGKRPVPVRELIRCFVQPFLVASLQQAPPAFTQLHCRLSAEPEELAMMVRSSIYNQSTRAYVHAFRATLSHLPEEVLYWRLHFMIGAYTYTLMRSGRLEFISGGLCESHHLDDAFKQILPFLEAGLNAPAP